MGFHAGIYSINSNRLKLFEFEYESLNSISMETKKSSKANLEKGKTVNFLLGCVVALATLFVSFEWGTAEKRVYVSDLDGSILWVEEIPITMPEPVLPPPPPPAQVVADVLTVLDNDAEVDETPIVTTEDTPQTPQGETYTPPIAIEEEEESEADFFIRVENMPVFPGGDAELLRFISQSIRYPVVAQENGLQGRVTCSFIVNTDGRIVDAEVVRGIDPSLDKEALRVINSMPKWEPGKQRGKPVRVKYTLPIIFRLQ